MHRAFTLFVLLAAMLAALVPSGAGQSHDAILVAFGFVAPTIQVTIVRAVATRSLAQPTALLSLHSFRAPPPSAGFAGI